MTLTKPLTLFVLVLLTVVALGVGYLAYSAAAASRSQRTAEIQACVYRGLEQNTSTKHCTR